MMSYGCAKVVFRRWIVVAIACLALGSMGCDGLFSDLDDVSPPVSEDAGIDADAADASDADDVRPDADADVPQESKPVVTTLDVDDVSNDGVTLRAEIETPGIPKAQDHGFCIDAETSPDPEAGEGDCRSLGEVEGEGEYQLEFERIVPGVVFQVEAYAENEAGISTGGVVEFMIAVDEISSADGFGCAIDEMGGLWCWGRNDHAQLGIGAGGDASDSAERVGERSDWKSITSGATHSCAIDEDDKLWCWGDDRQGQIGEGDDFGDVVDEPRQIFHQDGQDSQWLDVATGEIHTCAIDDDEQLWCWGVAENVDFFGNEFVHPAVGQGEEDDGGHFTPQPVDSDVGWKFVSAGAEHTCAIDDDEQLWCWGYDADDQLGFDPEHIFEMAFEPHQVDTDRSWLSVAAADAHTCGLDTDGQVLCWGDNDYGQLGVGDGASSEETPAEIIEVISSDWNSLSSNHEHSCVVSEDERLFCWGRGAQGQLGIDGMDDRGLPIQEHSSGQWIRVSTGHDHSCAISDDGRWKCWGQRPIGPSTPMQLETDHEFIDIDAGSSHSCAIEEDSTYCWGEGIHAGHDEDDEVEHIDSPQEVQFAESGGRQIVAGQGHSCSIDENRRAWCWGRGDLGQLGNDDEETRATPDSVDLLDGEIDGWDQLSIWGRHSCGIDIDDQLWCWGRNRSRELGIGEETDFESVPQPPAGEVDQWKQVAAGDRYNCAIDDEQRLWCWGWADLGQMGYDTGETHEDSPLIAGDDASFRWSEVAAGGGHTCAIDVDDQLWCWGYNNANQLGLGSDKDDEGIVSQIRQVDFDGGPESWQRVYAGNRFTCGIDDDGELWCWGSNASGQLGLGEPGDRNRPHRVAVDDEVADHGEEWEAVSVGGAHTLAIRDDGSVWVWGSNRFGQLGHDDAWLLTPTSIAEFYPFDHGQSVEAGARDR